MKRAAAVLAVLLAAPPALAAEPPKEPARAESERKAEPQISVAGAKSEEQVKAKLRADAMLQRCVIKPVMTDEEIETCKTAYRMGREAR